MRILFLDPGETTGFAYYNVNEIGDGFLEISGCWNTREPDSFNFLVDHLPVYPNLVVVESSPSRDGVSQANRLARLCQALEDSFLDYVSLGPGEWKPGSKVHNNFVTYHNYTHARDAVRMGWYYIEFKLKGRS